MKNFSRVVLAIVRKDIKKELHTKETVSSMLVFAILVVLVFNFTLSLDGSSAIELGSGILWTAFIFAATLGLNRSFASENENQSLSGIMMAPVDRSAIYFGKLVSNTIFMLSMEVFVLPIFIIFFNLNISEILQGYDLFWFGLVLLLGTIGFNAIGTILSAIAASTTMRDVLLPLLLLSFGLPVIIASAEATQLLFDVNSLSTPYGWISMLSACAISYTSISWMVFEYVVED